MLVEFHMEKELCVSNRLFKREEDKVTRGTLVMGISRQFFYAEVDGSYRQLYHFVVSLSKSLYPHCFS